MKKKYYEINLFFLKYTMELSIIISKLQEISDEQKNNYSKILEKLEAVNIRVQNLEKIQFQSIKSYNLLNV